MRHEALKCGAVNRAHNLMFPNGGDMKTRTIALTLALCCIAAAVCFASDVQVGTWKLNEAKSKIAAGRGTLLESLGRRGEGRAECGRWRLRRGRDERWRGRDNRRRRDGRTRRQWQKRRGAA